MVGIDFNFTYTSSRVALFQESAPSQLSEEDSFVLMDKFAELGGNFLDTANIYSGGRSEEIVGNWLSKYVTKHLCYPNVFFASLKIPQDMF